MNGRALLMTLVVPEPMRSPKVCTLLVKTGANFGSVDMEETVDLGSVTRRASITRATTDAMAADRVGFLSRYPRTVCEVINTADK
jgi:hypothetical protein